MPSLADKSIDLILSDLPYGTTGAWWDVRLPMDDLWAEYRRILKPRGAIVLTANQPFTTALIVAGADWFKYGYVWKKSRITGFPMANYRPMKAHEDILVFSPATASPAGKNNMTYNPQGLVVSGKTNKRTHRGDTVTGGYLSNNYVQKYTNYPQSILEFPHDGGRLHPTRKPVAMMEYLVRTYSNPGELVLDNCMGSGSTGVAALRSGRRFIGMEMNEEFYRVAAAEISKVNGVDVGP